MACQASVTVLPALGTVPRPAPQLNPPGPKYEWVVLGVIALTCILSSAFVINHIAKIPQNKVSNNVWILLITLFLYPVVTIDSMQDVRVKKWLNLIALGVLVLGVSIAMFTIAQKFSLSYSVVADKAALDYVL